MHTATENAPADADDAKPLRMTLGLWRKLCEYMHMRFDTVTGANNDNANVIRDLRARVEGLEARLQGAEGKSLISYHGVWTEGSTYPKGAFVTDHGGIWHANQQTNERPGATQSWSLAVKAGRR